MVGWHWFQKVWDNFVLRSIADQICVEVSNFDNFNTPAAVAAAAAAATVVVVVVVVFVVVVVVVAAATLTPAAAH